MRAVLEFHLKLCEDSHRLSLEENSFITTHKKAPDSAMLERRGRLFDQLSSNLEALKGAIAGATAADRGLGPLRDQVQLKIIQLGKLDRENEHFILRHSLPVRNAHGGIAPPPPAGAVAKLYSGLVPKGSG